jgi:hypothetical protein
MLPMVLYTSGRRDIFLIVYLLLIEGLIVAAVLIRKDRESLGYEVGIGKIALWQGIKKQK